MRGQGQNETFVLKHRLAGAAILIGFAVVVLPMLLGGPDNQAGDDGEAQRPGASSNQVFQSNIKPIGGEVPENRNAPDADSGDGSKRPESPPPSQEESRQPVVTAIEEDGPGAPGEDDDQARQAASEADGDTSGDDAGAGDIERGWIVQVGTFKNLENVQKLVDKLESGGFGSSTAEVATSEGTATRVWVGPFETRVEAARTKTRVKQSTGTEGLIVAYP